MLSIDFTDLMVFIYDCSRYGRRVYTRLSGAMGEKSGLYMFHVNVECVARTSVHWGVHWGYAGSTLGSTLRVRWEYSGSTLSVRRGYTGTYAGEYTGEYTGSTLGNALGIH